MSSVAAVPVHPGDAGFRRVIDIPIERLPCGTEASDLGYSPRLCTECAVTWFGIVGPDDAERVGLHGGDMCASCGYQPGSGMGMATSELKRVMVRALRAGAWPSALLALAVEAIETAQDDADFRRRDRPRPRSVQQRWPSTW